MLALDVITGHRIAAASQVLDAVESSYDGVSLRIGPDELFVLGAAAPDVGDEHTIVVAESGFAGCWLDAGSLARISEHIEWPLPVARPVLAQGLVAGVPAKLWLEPDRALLFCASAYVDDLVERLS